MVRVNLINPKALADQHLIAEYNEILMLFGYVKRYPIPLNIPSQYCLGKGHMTFFKDKLLYLQKRHETLKTEMRRRGFVTNMTVSLDTFDTPLIQDWKPIEKDKKIIRERILWKLKKKPQYYLYCREHKPLKFFTDLITNAH